MLFPSDSWPSSFRAPVWAIEWICLQKAGTLVHVPPVAWRLPATHHHHPPHHNGQGPPILALLTVYCPALPTVQGMQSDPTLSPKNLSPHKLGEQKVIWDRVPPLGP